MVAWSVYHVHALTPFFVSGGDDYLFLLIDGSCKVRATSSPVVALAAAAAVIVALVTLLAAVLACACSVLRFLHALRPLPSQAVDCCCACASPAALRSGNDAAHGSI